MGRIPYAREDHDICGKTKTSQPRAQLRKACQHSWQRRAMIPANLPRKTIIVCPPLSPPPTNNTRYLGAAASTYGCRASDLHLLRKTLPGVQRQPCRAYPRSPATSAALDGRPLEARTLPLQDNTPSILAPAYVMSHRIPEARPRRGLMPITGGRSYAASNDQVMSNRHVQGRVRTHWPMATTRTHLSEYIALSRFADDEQFVDGSGFTHRYAL